MILQLLCKLAKMAKDMVEQNKIQKEVEIVGEIQKSLLSANKKEPFPLAGINIPAKVVSGDFYNFNDLGDGKYGFGGMCFPKDTSAFVKSGQGKLTLLERVREITKEIRDEIKK